MTKTEALKLTLEELFAYQHLVDSEWGSCRSNEQIEIDGDTNPVITALKEVLAQPEQEPNGYVQTVIEALYENGDPVSVDAAELLQRITAQPEQEPLEYWNAVEGWVKIDEVRQHFETVSCGTIYKTAGEGRVPLYTTPPKRQPLTDGQKRELIKKSELWDMHVHIGWYSAPSKSFVEKAIQLISEIEAAHGIKETQ